MNYLKLLQRYEGKHRGDDYTIPCPFHLEKDPSLKIDVAGGYWRCFGCGKSGWLSAVIAKLENIPEEQARQIVKKYTNGKVIPTWDAKERRKKDPVFLDESEFDKFDVVRNSNYYSYMKSRGFSKKFVNTLDLREGSILEWSWRNRIVYAIRDIDGRIASIEGRDMGDNSLRYYKAKGSMSGLGMSGIDQVTRGNGLFVLEGYFDRLSMVKLGFRSAAMCCSSLTEIQIQQIRKKCKIPVVILDGLPKPKKPKYKRALEARKSTVKELRTNLSKFFSVFHILEIPHYEEDPNSLSPGRLRSFLDESFFDKYKNKSDFLI